MTTEHFGRKLFEICEDSEALIITQMKLDTENRVLKIKLIDESEFEVRFEQKAGGFFDALKKE